MRILFSLPLLSSSILYILHIIIWLKKCNTPSSPIVSSNLSYDKTFSRWSLSPCQMKSKLSIVRMSFFLKSDYEYIVYTLYILLVCSTTIIMYKKISLEFCKNSMRRRREKEGHSCKLDSNKAVWHTSLGKGTMALLLPYYKYSQKGST